MILIWDEWNIEHIGTHQVDANEAAEVVQAARRPFPQKIGRDRFVVRGQTARGRYLQVVYVVRKASTIDVAALDLEYRLAIEAGELIGYVIHARDLGHGERQTVRKRRR